MAKLWQRYTSDVYRGLSYLASWPPSARVEVGEVAMIQDRSLERQTSLAELGIEAPEVEGRRVQVRGWASSKTIAVSTGLSAAAPPQPGLVAGGEMQVDFKAKHAALLRAERSCEHSLDRLDSVKRELLRLHDEGNWDSDWVLVTQVIQARRLIALIANGKDASARLKLSGGTVEDAGALASAAGELTISSVSGMAYSELGIEDATPLYLAMRVQKRALREPRLKRIGKRGRARPGAGDFEVTDVTF